MTNRDLDAHVFSVNLDSWRLCLIILVVVNHSFLLGVGIWEDLNGIQRGLVALTFASVPTLSLFSGYLFASSQKLPRFIVIVQKIRTIVLPFIFWNTIIYLFIVAINRVVYFSDYPLFLAQTNYIFLNGISGVYAAPANEPLYFLRDLFVCVLIFSLLRNFMKYRIFLIGLIAFFTVNYFYDFDQRVILRNTIPLFFLLGYLFFANSFIIIIANKLIVPAALFVFALIVTWSFGHNRWSANSVFELIILISCSFLVFGLTCRPLFNNSVADWGRRFSFTIFLSHWWTLLLLQNLWNNRGWGDWSYVVFGSLTAVATGIALACLISKLPVAISTFLTGDRVRRERPPGSPRKA